MPRKKKEVNKEVKEEISKYYSLEEVEKGDPHYCVIIGKRSNGKTYACLKRGLENYVNKGEQMAYIRRWDNDFRGKDGSELFANHTRNGLISELTNGKWSSVYSYSGKWYLCNVSEDGKITKDSKPFCYGFAISQEQKYKSYAYPEITTIIFDEFISSGRYVCEDEFVLFNSILSTIIRRRDNVRIYMLGNTINPYCPYFAEMGIDEVKNMEAGTIKSFSYGESGLRVNVEYCKSDNDEKSKYDSDVYFAFNNPKLKMITDGEWEIGLYPHCPCKYKPKDIEFVYFIKFVDEILQCEIISNEYGTFTYIHKKTTEIKDEDNDLVFSREYSPKLNYRRNLLKPTDNAGRIIKYFFDTDRVFYQNNMVGETVRNYLETCKY